MLSMYVEDNQTDWDLHLQSVMLAYRSTVQDTSVYTPDFLMTGRQINLPIDVMFRGTQQPSTHVPHQSILPKSDRHCSRHTSGSEKNTQSCQRRQKDYYDRRVHGSPYSVGDRLWLHVPYVKRGRSPKLCRPWQGPYTVIKKLSDVTYRIQQSRNGIRRRQVVHFNRIKPYSEPSERNSQDVQRLDTDRETGDQIAPSNRLLTAERTIPDADGVQPGSVIDATAELYENDNDLGDCPPETDCGPVLSPPNPLVGQEDAVIPDDAGVQQPTHTADNSGHLPNAVTPDIPQLQASSTPRTTESLPQVDQVQEPAQSPPPPVEVEESGTVRTRRPPTWARDYEFYT